MTNRIDTAAERARLAALEGHTPGPWQCSRADLASYDADTGARVSYLYPGDGERVRFETDNPVEDARLAAAAPDLKAAYAAALDEIDRLREALGRIADYRAAAHAYYDDTEGPSMTTDTIAAARALIEPLTEHTPGQWETFFGEAYRVRSDGMNIATAHFVTLLDRIPTKVVASNTRLIAAAPALRDMVATLADALEAERAARQKAEDERDVLKMRADNHWETLRCIRYIAQTSGNLGRIIQWVDDAGSGYTETAEATLAQVIDERDQALARLAVAYEAVAQRWERAAAHDQGGIDYSDAVGVPISNRAELAQSVKAHTYSAYAIRALTPAGAQATLDKLLAEARREGWRAGRDAAADCTEDYCSDMPDLAGHGNSVGLRDAIRALPEPPKEASHE